MNKVELIDSIQTMLLNSKKVLTVNELAEYTKLSKSFIYKLTQTHRIPFSRPNGKLIFFDREKIDQWLLSNPVNAVQDIEQIAINYITGKSYCGGKND